MLTPLFYEDPLKYCLPLSLFSNFIQPPPTFLSSPTPTPTPTVLSVVLFLWMNGWSRHIWCAILLNGDMDLHMSSFRTLLPERPWCMFYAIRCQVYWGLSVHFGINLPSKTTPLSFLPIPPSNLQTAQASLYNGFSLTPYLKFVFFGEGFDP